MLQTKQTVQHTNGITLSVKARPQFFDKQHVVNEAVKFPVAFLEKAELVLINKIFACVRV